MHGDLMSGLERYLPASRTARLAIRAVLALVCFVIAVILSVMPGPAFVFWIAGFVLLGFSVGQILLSVHAVQEFLHDRVPYADRLPRLRKYQIRRLMRHRWVRTIDAWSSRPDDRRRRREARRAAARARRARGARRAEPAGHENPGK
jgi:hypothetical protein